MTEPRHTEGVYEVPRVERVLSPEELEREVQYAGSDETLTPPDGDSLDGDADA